MIVVNGLNLDHLFGLVFGSFVLFVFFVIDLDRAECILINKREVVTMMNDFLEFLKKIFEAFKNIFTKN